MFVIFLFTFFLFLIGTFGVFISRYDRHFIIVLVSLEIILLSSVINFVAASFFLSDFMGQIFALIILTIAAVETALGLSLLMLYFRRFGRIYHVDIFSYIKRF